jgi:predicted nucleic acid-binding protein
MYAAIISDTSCLILYDNIHQLDLIHLVFSEIYTTSVVAAEFGKPLPNWIKIADPKRNYSELISLIDKGEASAIALAYEIPNCLLILDDLQARQCATKLGINITGSLGILVKAKEKGIIKEVKYFLSIIKATNFRLSEKLENEILKQAGE